jgi:tellurite resistance protein
MSLPDRILPLCDLLLGAAHADQQLQAREHAVVRELLTKLLGGSLTTELEERFLEFAPAKFKLAATAAEFRGDSEEDRRHVLELVAAVHDADGELDLAENDYLIALAGALELPASALDGLAVEVEVEELREALAKVRKVPPPPPRARKPTVG